MKRYNAIGDESLIGIFVRYEDMLAELSEVKAISGSRIAEVDDIRYQLKVKYEKEVPDYIVYKDNKSREIQGLLQVLRDKGTKAHEKTVPMKFLARLRSAWRSHRRIQRGSVVKINKKIVGYKVASPTGPHQAPKEVMHESVERPEHLRGSTYKLKTPLSDHALYLTINDVLLNEGTDHEEYHPYEVFINSKEMEYYQWVTALTRVISAVFRKGGDIVFLIEELKTINDPKGGFWYKGKQVGSLVALIGATIETHLSRGVK